MNLTEAAEDKIFREEVRDFLDQALTPDLRRAGDRMTSIFSDFHASLEWQSILYQKRWLAPDWPSEYGGVDWTLRQKVIFSEESSLADAPALLPFGIQMLGPIIIKFGTDEQRSALLPRILTGEDLWCQGYSEPGAGSDLASLQMLAVPDGDDYVINGSKIWTSFAQHSNKIFCLVRTKRTGKPQAGISFLPMDIDLPGIAVRPIVSLDGEVEQCQVMFEDVRVHRSNLVGRENQGWAIAKHLLEFERGGYCYHASIGKQLRRLHAMARMEKNENDVLYAEDAEFRGRLSELEVDKLSLEYLEHRINAMAAKGGNPGALSSVTKVVGTELSQRLDELSLELRGVYVAPLQNHVFAPDYTGDFIGSEKGAPVMNSYLNNRGATIYGGSAQIQRNIIAKALLGL